MHCCHLLQRPAIMLARAWLYNKSAQSFWLWDLHSHRNIGIYPGDSPSLLKVNWEPPQYYFLSQCDLRKSVTCIWMSGKWSEEKALHSRIRGPCMSLQGKRILYLTVPVWMRPFCLISEPKQDQSYLVLDRTTLVNTTDLQVRLRTETLHSSYWWESTILGSMNQLADLVEGNSHVPSIWANGEGDSEVT